MLIVVNIVDNSFIYYNVKITKLDIWGFHATGSVDEGNEEGQREGTKDWGKERQMELSQEEKKGGKKGLKKVEMEGKKWRH